jgi:hypothetical protein
MSTKTDPPETVVEQALPGSPVSRVAPVTFPVAETEDPASTIRSAKASLAGAAWHNGAPTVAKCQNLNNTNRRRFMMANLKGFVGLMAWRPSSQATLVPRSESFGPQIMRHAGEGNVFRPTEPIYRLTCFRWFDPCFQACG